MVFKLYQARVEESLLSLVDKMGEKTRLRDACEYALLSGGKRLRPILVLMVAEALGNFDAMPAALSVECFHTASLIADDLPCMDDDAERRGIPSLHTQFGESTALLASYTLIARGYEGIYENAKRYAFPEEAEKRALLALGLVSRLAGIQGATQGQFLDLFCKEPTPKVVEEIIHKKTATLFEIAFLFGWLFGGGDFARIPLLQKSALHLGMAFQIADDLQDTAQDFALQSMNFVSILGKEKAISRFEQEINLLQSALQEAGLWTRPFQHLVERLARCHLFFV